MTDNWDRAALLRAQPERRFGHILAPAWHLDPATIYLNHGGFGAVPISVLDCAERWRRRIETNPTRFMETELAPLLRDAAGTLAAFLGASGDDLVFVDNATTGINAVLRSLVLMPGDEVVTTSHLYKAVSRTLEFVCERAGARLIHADVPFPISSAGEVVASVTDVLTPRTRLLVIDHVTSPTALALPIEQLVSIAAESGIPVLIDGAHAPGNLPLDLNHLGGCGVAWYVGNCHKWLGAAKGCGFLWAHPDRQRLLRPTAIGNQFGQGFTAAFDWPGTKDFAPWLAITAALDFWKGHGVDEARAYCHELAYESAGLLRDAWGGASLPPRSLTNAMVSVQLPLAGAKPNAATAAALRDRLRQDYDIEAPVMAFADRLWVRISAFLYNEIGDYERLAEAGRQILRDGV